MRKRILAALLVTTLCFAGCQSSTQTDAPVATPTITEAPESTDAATPTETACPTEAVMPTEAPSSEERGDGPIKPESTEAPEVTEVPVITEEPVVEPTSVPVPTKAPAATPEPTPTVPPVEDDKPSGWSGKYDSLVTNGFDHIKVPTRDDFNDKGFNASTKDSVFDFDGSDWSEEWYDAYQDFLVANGSPIGSDGKPMGAFNAIHDGNIDGYQYLYYGINWDGSNNGWGDIILYNSGMYHGWEGSKAKYEDFKDAYFFELVNFTYGKIDKGVENEYRAASTMMLSWICSNPSQVEKVIYEFIVDKTGSDKLSQQILANGFGHWLQVGDVDVCVMYSNSSEEAFQFAIREHDSSKSMIGY